MQVFDVERAREIDNAVRRINPTTVKTVLAVMGIPNVIEDDAGETVENLIAGSEEETAIISEHRVAIGEAERFQVACVGEIKSIRGLAKKFAN